MDFLEELEWRGMLHNATPGIKEALAAGSKKAYIGFDPTAPSLTIGNFVQIMLLKLFQLSGHQPIVLMGGATGRVGDPSFKATERELKTFEELDGNLAHQVKHFHKFLDFEGPLKAEMVNNLDFYKDMHVLDFLRDVGKTMTVNYMLSKESVKQRLQTGISFTEFSYQLLQGYDFQRLYQDKGVIMQMGGSDQWGNITTGTEFIRKNAGGHAFALTTPLLTKADGSKFGKSESGNIWLDPEKTSPYKFYQFWINADDRDIPKFTRYFTLKSKEEVEALEAEHADNPNALKRLLAEELTTRVHSRTDFEAVEQVSELLFNKKAKKDTLLKLDVSSLETVAAEIPSFYVPMERIADGINIVDLLAEETTILNSKGEARKAIKGNAIAINKDKIQSHETIIRSDSLLHGKYIMIENGKKNKRMVVVG